MIDFDNIKYEKVDMISGSIGEEIQRLLATRPRVDGEIDRKRMAPLATSIVLGFVHFVFGMIVFNLDTEEMPTVADVLGVLNNSNLFESFRLYHTLLEFLPVWLDSQKGDGLDWMEAENITDLFNKWVREKAAQS